MKARDLVLEWLMEAGLITQLPGDPGIINSMFENKRFLRESNYNICLDLNKIWCHECSFKGAFAVSVNGSAPYFKAALRFEVEKPDFFDDLNAFYQKHQLCGLK